MLGAETNYTIVKCVTRGNGKNGKTAVFRRMQNKSFISGYNQTIGVEFANVIDSSRNIKLQIWDIAGQEPYVAITNAYYRGAKVCCLFIDVTSPDPKVQIEQWLDVFSDYLDLKVPVCVIGTKGDLITDEIKLSQKNNDLAMICEQVEKPQSMKNVSYLGITSAQDAWWIDSEWKKKQEKKNIHEDLFNEIVKITLASLPQPEVTPAVPQTGEGTSEDPTQSLLGASTQSSSRFFTIPLKANWRKTRLAIRLGMSVVATGGLFPSLFMACALLSYAGESFKDNQIKQKSNSPKKGYDSTS